MRSAFESQPTVMGARVVVTTIFMAAAVAVLGMTGKSFDEFAIGPEVWPEKPWLFVTTNFIHIGALHVLFNLYWMWGLGAQVEEQYGPARTLGFILLFAVVPAAAEWGFFGAGVGLSGVVYGWFGMRWALSRHHPDHRGAMPQKLVELMVGWFFLCVAMTYFDVLGVANVAHGAGGVVGYLTGWALSPARSGDRRLLTRFPGAWRWGILSAFVVICLSAGTVGRRLVNLSPLQRWRMLFQDGIEAFEEEDMDRAAEAFSRAAEMFENDGGTWFNLGLASERLGRREEAVEALERAVALEPRNEKFEAYLEDLRD